MGVLHGRLAKYTPPPQLPFHPSTLSHSRCTSSLSPTDTGHPDVLVWFFLVRIGRIVIGIRLLGGVR